MAHLNVTGVDPFNGTCTVNAWSRHWSGTLSMNATWWDSVVVDANLTVPSGVTLTINPGTKIVSDSGVTITVNGLLLANGEEGDSIRFMAAPGVSEWGGIYLNGGYASVSYSVIKDARVAFWAENAGVSDIAMQLTDTRFDGGTLKITGSPTRTHYIERVTIHDVPEAFGISGFNFLNTSVYAEDFTVLRSGYRTGSLSNTTGIILRGHFSGQANDWGLMFWGSTNGIQLKCCQIEHIAPDSTNPGASVWCQSNANPLPLG